MAKFLRVREVCDRLGCSRAQVYRLMERGVFPKQIAITPGGRGIAWLESDVTEYIERRVAATRRTSAQPTA